MTDAPAFRERDLLTSREFIRRMLRVDAYDRQDAMFDLIDGHRRVAVAGAHSVGKTFGIAAYALRYLLRYPDAIVLTTAPTWEQVKRLLWGNIKKVMRRIGLEFPRMFELEVGFNEQNYMLGLSTNEGVRFQGFHSGHLLVIFDEAPGVREDIWMAADGAAAGGQVTIVALGNPITPSGRFYECFKPDSVWETLQIGAFETPNLQNPATGLPFTLDELLALPEHDLDGGPRPELTTRRWVRDMYREYGPGSPEWEGRVMARFPEMAHDALIPLPWLRASQRAGLQFADTFTRDLDIPWTCGIDVAGEGRDETVVAVAHGDALVAVGRFREVDPRPLVHAFLDPYALLLTRGNHRPSVRVDANGQGYYFARWLEEAGFRGFVGDVNVAMRPDTFIPAYRLRERTDAVARFDNLKAAFFWSLRDRFREGKVVGVALDETAVQQLGGLKYAVNERTGRIVIEGKEALRKRGVPSPDVAEAIMLAYAPLTALPRIAAVSATVARRGSHARR